MMQKLYSHLSYEWAAIYAQFMSKAEYNDGYVEALSFSYEYSPAVSMIMSYDSTLFKLDKAAAMYFWYKKADEYDYSILEYFTEYARCVDDVHKAFNSNYGIYAYRKGGLLSCVITLLKNRNSRHAMFFINNDEAMSELSIDKLCTNNIQFLIRNNKLEMIVQMRSSNFVTLLPYDAFMFSTFYFFVYYELVRTYPDLKFGKIHMQVASLHMYEKDIEHVEKTEWLKFDNVQYNDKNWQNNLEHQLLNALINRDHDSRRIHEETQREDS